MFKSHSVVEVFLHFVFVTKYRRKSSILEQSNIEFIKEMFDLIAVENGAQIEDLNIGNSNHIHFLITIDGNIPISVIANKLKSKSSKILADELRKKQDNCITEFWPGWQNGYYCGSVGNINKEQITNYIKQQ